MIMWAFPKNNCDPTNTGSYTKTIKGYQVTIPTSRMTDKDFDACLSKNFIDPREGQAAKMQVNLNYSPESPINDPSADQMGDTLVAHASVSNASKETSQLRYTWTVLSNDTMTLNETDWHDITSTLRNDKLKLIDGPTQGNGIDSLNIKLNMDSSYNDFLKGVGYLRIKVKVEEIFDSGDTRVGRNDVIVKVISTNQKVNAYSVSYSGGLLDLDKPICKDIVPGCVLAPGKDCNVQKFTCFVLKNEIVGAQVSGSGMENFLWTLNGKPLNCSPSISNLCTSPSASCASGECQTDTNFFPVTGNPGDTYTLDVTAVDITNKKTIHLVRNFQVIDPFVEITSTDQNSVWPKFLGYYVGLNGANSADFSKSDFETFLGNTANLQAVFHPDWLISNLTTDPLIGGLNFEWLVDGEKQDSSDNLQQLTPPLSITKDPGEVYNVTVNAVYYRSQQVRQALQDIWGISQFDSPETSMSNSIQIEIVQNEVSMKNNPKNFLANLASHIPSQVMFMLRILLTIFVILITTSIVFSFMPGSYEREEKMY